MTPADSWHYLYLSGLSAVSLFADPGSAANEATLQWVLTGFDELYAPTSKELAMKGLWNSEKSVDATYRPALDALRAVDGATLAEALLAVVENGSAIMVAATRDQGAIALTLLDGEKRHRVYVSNVQDLHTALADLIESMRPQLTGRAPEPKKR